MFVIKFLGKYKSLHGIFVIKFLMKINQSWELESWISGLMLDPLFFLISRLNNACSHHVINLQIN